MCAFISGGVVPNLCNVAFGHWATLLALCHRFLMLPAASGIIYVLFSWYHGSISRRTAEQLLRMSREGSYLVRTSESNRLDYSLSVRSVRICCCYL